MRKAAKKCNMKYTCNHLKENIILIPTTTIRENTNHLYFNPYLYTLSFISLIYFVLFIGRHVL